MSLVDARTGRAHVPRRPGPDVVVHPAHGSVRFKCACGVVHKWPINPRPKSTVPESHRSLRCGCGRVHTR